MKPNSNESSGGGSGQLVGTQSYRIITQYGDMLVIKQGIQPHHHHQQQHDRQSTHNHTSSPHHHHHQTEHQQQHQARPVIMTFHDIGLNSELQFARFCDCDEVKLMLQTFTMIHVNFIGQEFDSSSGGGGGINNGNSDGGSPSGRQLGAGNQPAANLPDDFKYPNVDQMAESVVDICTQLKVRSFIGLAVGAGAYIVSTLALMRPDLIDGLFLINPVITSCSITEWLYFKMSAIASNHHIGGGSSLASSSAASAEHNAHNSSSTPPPQPQPQPHQQSSSQQKSGLRKLISAATHLHLSHHHQPSQPVSSTTDSGNESGSTGRVPSEYDAETGSVGQDSVQSSHSIPPKFAASPAAAVAHSQSSGSRLRQLIFSRNLRQLSSGSSNSASSSLHRQSSTATVSNDNVDNSATDVSSLAEPHHHHHHHKEKAKEEKHGAAEHKGKRAPLEYLMYHHFGPASFQRYRRSSDTSSMCDSRTELNSEGGQQQQDAGSTSSRHSSPASASGGSLGRAHSSGRQPTAGGGGGRVGRRRRSGSVCMNATYLASFSNDRQRHAYIQRAYKHHFHRINSHNLWLFAQSFVKRRTLNLRKDCGAAAHAAAAAATLGTSICTAFVGLGPVSDSAGRGPRPLTHEEKQASGISAKQDSTTMTTATNKSSGQQPRQSATSAAATSPKQQQQQALVAGTKVKRTFTCQTLIMCSSVPMHCERAFKLMSLLNPLQATWIKTDHLLVLEERPDKVCQALRLFLQGIGYSMSTYERRLRLSSTTGSAGSADSSGSARSSFTADAGSHLPHCSM